MENNVPNLDAMPHDELMTFWATYQRSGRKRAIELFGQKREGYTRVASDLANYASNKATAMGCRVRGDIQTALMYEGICDRIYKSLPEWARW
jgi:hypothetical protein